jgi:hypothetical protein
MLTKTLYPGLKVAKGYLHYRVRICSKIFQVWQPSDHNDVAFGFFDVTLPIILLHKL